MEVGDKYLSGELDLGAAGSVKIVIFKNDHKKEEKHPDHIIYLSKGDEKPKKIGALWVNVKKQAEIQPEKVDC